MKKLILLALILINTNAFCQNLSLQDLFSICNKSNWNQVNVFMLNKNWEYFSSTKGDKEKFNTIVWSLNKNGYSDKAQGWLHLFTYDGLPSKIEYSFFNRQAYSLLHKGILTSGLKLVKNSIDDNEISFEYSGTNFIVKILTQKRDREEDYNSENSITVYTVTVVKKTGIYDFENGLKKEYYDSGNIKVEYTLKDNKKEGLMKWYYENGNVEQIGNYVNDVKNGLFLEYDERGIIQAKYNMKNGKANGIVTIYNEGLKFQEITKLNGISNGKFINYFYDLNNVLIKKIEGFYINEKEEGVWKVFSVNSKGELDLLEFTSFKEGVKHGEFKEYINKDTLITGFYKNGLLDGYFTKRINQELYDTAINRINKFTIESEGNYLNGLKDGKWKYYFYGNLFQEGNYNLGLKIGKWVRYVPLGRNRGKIWDISNYENGLLNGVFVQYYEKELDTVSKNPTLDFVPVTNTYHYRNDKLNGPFTLLDSANFLIVSGYYTDGMKNNSWIYFSKNGDVLKIQFNNGKIEKNEMFNANEEPIYSYAIGSDGEIIEDFYVNNYKIERNIIRSFVWGHLATNYIYKISDTTIVNTYKIHSMEEYNSKLLTDFGVLDGQHYLIIKNDTILDGSYCNNKKCGNWKKRYPQIGVYTITNYSISDNIEEYFDFSKNNKISGNIEIVEDGLIKKIKLKNGLKNGRTVVMNLEGAILNEYKYKMGLIKK